MAKANFRRFAIYLCIVVGLILLAVFAYSLISAESIPLFLKVKTL